MNRAIKIYIKGEYWNDNKYDMKHWDQVVDGDCDGSHNTDDDEKSKINKKIGTVKSTQRAEKKPARKKKRRWTWKKREKEEKKRKIWHNDESEENNEDYKKC